MKIAVFWNKIQQDCLSDKHIKKTVFDSLITPNLINTNFGNFFNSATQDSLYVYYTPNGIINTNGILINPENFNDFDAFFISAELTWLGHEMSDFFGLTIVRKLRLKNFKCPVFICSFMPENYFSLKSQFKILDFRGHYFLRLPNGLNEDLETSPLDEMELLDCKMHYCGVEGSIREIYHRKQHILPEDDFESAKNHILELLHEIKQLTDLPENLKPEIEKLIIEVDNIEELQKLKVFCKSDETRILGHLKESDRDVPTTGVYEAINGDWKILILEDVRKDIEPLLNSLKLAGIKEENILHAVSFDEAKAIIKSDIGNKITVVVCDYRIEKDGKQKGRQGYSFVEWLSKQDRFNEIFIYSGLARRFLKETFKQYNIRVNVNSKYDVADSMGNFVDEVIDKGNEIAELVLHRPTTEAWREMEVFYRNYRQWPGYDRMEKEISEFSRNIINQIKYLRETIEKYDLKEKVSFSPITTLPNLAGRIFKDFEKSKVETDLQLLSNYSSENIRCYPMKGKKDKETGLDTTKEVYYCFPPITDEKYRENYFKNKLVARRIAWWLLMVEGIHLNTVYSLLSKGEYVNNYFRKTENSEELQSQLDNEIPETIDAKTLINTRLAVIREDFPYRLLVEEKNWFKYEMNTDLNDLMSTICGFENYFTNIFESLEPNMNKQKKEYCELKNRFIINDKFLFHTANDIRKALELSIKSLDEPNDQKQLLYKVLERHDSNDMICKPYFDKLENYCLNQIKSLNYK